MAWVTLQYTKGQVDAAGLLLAKAAVEPTTDPLQIGQALDVVNNWRSAHSFPLNTFQMGLRRRAENRETDPLVAQRLKRVPSIVQKIHRFPTMKLSRMQDIGGCRAVLATVVEVRGLRRDYLKSDIKHELVNEKDYITQPQASGYRGIHLVYKYNSDKNAAFTGRLIEVQLRTWLQHSWATGVETVGTFLNQSLKASQGSADWLRFFALASSAFAAFERGELVPDTPTKRSELISELVDVGQRVNVQRRLRAYGTALQVAQDTTGDAHYFLLSLQPLEGKLAVRTFARNQLPEAMEAYLAEEKSLPPSTGGEVVLVSVDSLDALRRAYPNYFLNTDVFFSSLSRITRRRFD